MLAVGDDELTVGNNELDGKSRRPEVAEDARAR